MMKHVEMTGQVRTIQNIAQNTRYMYMYVLHVMISLFLLSESVAPEEDDAKEPGSSWLHHQRLPLIETRSGRLQQRGQKLYTIHIILYIKRQSCVCKCLTLYIHVCSYRYIRVHTGTKTV